MATSSAPKTMSELLPPDWCTRPRRKFILPPPPILRPASTGFVLVPARTTGTALLIARAAQHPGPEFVGSRLPAHLAAQLRVQHNPVCRWFWIWFHHFNSASRFNSAPGTSLRATVVFRPVCQENSASHSARAMPDHETPADRRQPNRTREPVPQSSAANRCGELRGSCGRETVSVGA